MFRNLFHRQEIQRFQKTQCSLRRNTKSCNFLFSDNINNNIHKIGRDLFAFTALRRKDNKANIFCTE